MICINFSKYSGQMFDSKMLTKEQTEILFEIFKAGGAVVYNPETKETLGEFKVVKEEN